MPSTSMFITVSSLLLHFKIKQNVKAKREFIYVNKLRRWWIVISRNSFWRPDCIFSSMLNMPGNMPDTVLYQTNTA